MNNISKSIHKEIDEKMKKIIKSTEIIKKQEEKRIKNIENRKLNQYTSYYYNISNINEKIRKIHEKEKVKFVNVKENIDHINRTFNERQDSLYNQLNEKYRKQRENKKSHIKFDEYIHRRKLSLDRFNENTFILSKHYNNNPRNGDIMRFQHSQNIKSVEKNKSLNVSREGLK